MTITYLIQTPEMYVVGSAIDYHEALRLSRLEDQVETYFFYGKVEKLIREIGPKKVINLVRIVQNKTGE